MALSDRESELIQKYLDKELSPSEQAEVGELQGNSSDFREELYAQKAIVSSLKAQEKARKIAAVKAMVLAHEVEINPEDHADVGEEQSDDETPVIPLQQSSTTDDEKKTGFAGFYKIAAAVVVLAVASVVVYNQVDSGPTSGELYASYYEPLEASVSTRSYTIDGDANPVTLYSEGNYDAAVGALRSALEQPDASPTLNIYLGISLLETGREAEAETLLRAVYAKDPNDFVGQHAEWFLALTQLKKDAATAKEAFQKIADQGGVYERQAKEILEKL